MTTRSTPSAGWLRTAVLAAGVASAASVAAAESRPVVAEATLVIGSARIVPAEGPQRAVEKGAAVRVGDRIETDAGGHVHLRFVDGARVSVRPSSRLAVEDYSRSTVGGAGAIKFQLQEGVVRSITGAWGEASREGFRLNTPLAAIGIKGTDFVTRADAGATVASVFTGAIVVAPLDAGCSSTVGPCLNGREALLTQDMRGQIVQVARDQARPAVVTVAARSGEHTSGFVRAHDVTPIDVAVVATPSDAVSEGKTLANATRADDALVTATLPPRVEQLAWGHWSWATPIAGDDLAQLIDAAFRAGRDALITDGAYALFRPVATDARLLAKESSATFRLAGGSAHVVRRGAGGGAPLPATVEGGTLGVDFARSTFTTHLTVTGEAIGSHDIHAAGNVLATGVLTSTSGNASVTGGLSLDGREAGYLFDKAIDAGQLRGITLWGR